MHEGKCIEEQYVNVINNTESDNNITFGQSGVGFKNQTVNFVTQSSPSRCTSRCN